MLTIENRKPQFYFVLETKMYGIKNGLGSSLSQKYIRK